MKKEITWTTAGAESKIAVELITEEKIRMDGYEATRTVCRIDTKIAHDGKDMGYGFQKLPKPVEKNGRIHTHRAGNLAIPDYIYRQYEQAIAEIKSTPEWQAKEKADEAIREADKKYDAHRDMMRKHMGY